jgi:hypothetical protein
LTDEANFARPVAIRERVSNEDTSMSLRSLSAISISCFALVFGGCSAQTGPEYVGERITSVDGTLSKVPVDPALEGVDVAIVWRETRSELKSEKTLITRVQGPGDASAPFSLKLLAPPGDANLASSIGQWNYNEPVRIAIGYIMALKPGAPIEKGYEVLTDYAVGVSTEHILVYFDRDVPGTSILAREFGGPLAAGYYLMRASFLTNDEKNARDACVKNASAAGKDNRVACFPALRSHVRPVRAGIDDKVVVEAVPPKEQRRDFVAPVALLD